MAEDLEEDFEDGEAADDSPKAASKGARGLGGKKKLILLIVLPLLLVVGGAAGAYFSGAIDALLGKGGGEKEVEHKEAAPGGVQAAVFYDLPEMLVNLNTAGRKQSFLKIRVSLELENALDATRIEQVMPRIVDNFQVYLRELRVEDLQGAQGMYRLREELLTRVNAAAKPAKVNDVLFKEMLVQ